MTSNQAQAQARDNLEQEILSLRESGRIQDAWSRTIEHAEFDRKIKRMARHYAAVMFSPASVIPDAINEGRIEARKAILQWDPQQGPYIKYAVYKARSGITRCLGNNLGVVRTPPTTREKLSQLRAALRSGETIEDSEDVARILGVKIATAERLYRCLKAKGEVSLDAPKSDDDERSLHHFLGNTDTNHEERLGQEGASVLLKKMKEEYLTGDIRRNSSRNWEWFMEHFGIVEVGDQFRLLNAPKTYEEIGNGSGVKKNVVHSAVGRLIETFQKRGYYRKIIDELLHVA